jgi:hypothetical protein
LTKPGAPPESDLAKRRIFDLRVYGAVRLIDDVQNFVRVEWLLERSRTRLFVPLE